MSATYVRLSVLASGLAMGLALGTPHLLAVQDKPMVRITEAQARAGMAKSITGAKGNDMALQSTFQKEMRALWSDYTNTPFLLHDSAEIQVSVLGPAQMLIAAALDKIKMSQPLENLWWSGGVVIQVSPFNAQALNVVKTVVTRDGKEIEPTQSGLKEQTINQSSTSAAGRTSTVHSGYVVYPVSAFDLGGKVQVDAVLDSGRKLSRTLADRELRKIQ